MEEAKRKLLEQTHQTILKVGFEDNDYELVADLISSNFVGFGTAIDEKIFGIKDLKALLKRQKEQSKGIDINVELSTLHTHLSENENTAIYIDEGVLSIATDEEPIEMILRLSLVLEYIEDKWLMVHFHSSKPEEVESEKDTWGIETWKEKAEELEKEVAERTADLVLKNRDLAIEAALERVRARSMAMHSSNELNQVVAVLFENLKELQIPVTAAGIQVYLEDSEDMLNYVCGENSDGLVISHYRMPYFDNAIINDFKDARDKKDGFIVGNYSKKIKDSFYNYLFDNTEIKDVPDDIKQMIFDSEAYTISMAPVSNSLIAINDFQGNELSENHVEIIQRFAKVFEQAYIRFRDLEKAEAQAREAQIEAALERVRSASMAMHKTEDLADVVVVYFEQLNDLQIEFIQSWITIFHLDKGYVDVWFSPLNGIYDAPTHFKMPGALFEETSIKSWKEGLPFSYISFSSKEAVDQFFQICDDVTGGNYFRDIQKKLKLEHFEMLDANHKYGCISKSNTMKATDEEKDILQRFAKVFEQTYTRFLDLQKAEGQAREAQIEAALEKVRSRSMAMHNSQELKEVALELRKQMGLLGQKDLEVCAIHLYGNDEDSFESWSAMKASGSETEIVQTQAHFPKRGIRIVDEMVHHYTIGTKDYILVNEGEKIAGWFKVLKKHAPELHSSILDSIGKVPVKQLKANWAVADFSGGALVMVTYGEPDEVSRNLLRRSANVFEQAYVRFLDLQKAEAQAREAQIQLCLERVRAKSMAMQSSNELETIIQVVHDQFVDLGVTLDHAGFIIDYKLNDDMIIWLADEHKVTPQIRLSYFDSPHWNSFITAKEKGHKLFVNHLDFKTKNKFYKQIFKYVPELPEDAQSFYLKIPSLTIATSLIDTIGLYIENFSGVQYGEEDQKILLRFGEEFQQAYTRFLDLKKVEAQARESQIQLSLERVRAKSMAMQSSDALHEVIGVVFQQFDNLGIHPVNVFLSLFHREERTLTYRASGKSGKRTPTKQVVDIDSVEAWTDLYNKWINDSSDDIEVIFYPKELVPEIFKLLKETFAAMPKADRMTVEDFPEGGYSTLGYTPFGYLGYDHTRPPTEEEKDILKRICTEFGRVYQRFLDIKKAEAQAREAQIEAALEKVRSRSLAMHHSDEVGEVANILLKKLEELELNIDNEAVIMILSQDGTRNSEMWLASPDIYDSATLFDTPYMGSKLEKALWDKIEESNVDYFTKQFSKKVKNEYFNLAFEHSEFKYLPEDRKQYVLDSETYSYFCALKKYTSIVIPCHTGKLLTIDQIEILKRFSRVLEQAYIRFQDLKKAEAQARESEIQLALERVRASSLAMQSSADLTEVLTVLFSQFNVLGIQPLFAHLTLFDEENNRFSVRMTGRQGQRILAEQYIDVDEVESWKESYIKWQNGQPGDIDCIYYPPEVLGQVLDVLKELNDALPKRSKLHVKDFPDGSYTIQANFEYGYIGFNDDKMATEEQQAIVKRFAKEFSSAYRRFLDIEKAEAQAREANIQLALERLRASTMAMKTQGDLLDVIDVFGSQLTSLGINVDTLTVIHGVPKGDWDLWLHTPDSGVPPFRVNVPYIDTAFFTKSIKNIEEYERTGNPIHFKAFNKEEKDEFLTHYFNHAPPIPEEFKALAFAQNQTYVIEAFLEEVTVSLLKYELENFSEEDIKIFTRFSLEFKQTYTRFLDLKKAEDQARQAQIEVSLERVRSRAMAMHQTDELTDVLCVLFDQFDILGINPVLTHLTLFDEENQTFSLRITTTAENRIVAEQYIDVNAIDAWKDSFENWKKSEPNAINCIDYEPEVIPMVWELLSEVMNALPKGHRIYPKDFPDGLYTTQGHFKFGYIGFNNTRRATEEEKEIVVRFAKEFGRTYQRFLDIEKAEVQAREAQIEAALEKVRSRSLGMQQSNEMQQVANEVHQQLRNLGLDIDAMAMSGVIDNESDYDVWVGGEDYEKPLRIPYNNDTKIQRDYNKAIKERPEHFTKTYKGKTKDAYFEHLMATNAFNPKLKKMMLECSAFTTTLTFMKNSGMQIIRYNDNAFSDEDNSIVKRFGRVFEQAYIRFLDLQKAEAQTREAQIEAALEKVRSRSMGMQKSTELLEVITVVSQQLQTLGFRFSHASFINNSLKEHNSFWVAATGLPNPMRFIIPYKTMPVIDNLRKAQKNKDAFYTDVSSIKEHQQWFQHLLNHSGENVFPKEIIDYQMSKGLARSVSIHTNIMLALANTQSEPYSDYENKIIARFGQVFEQSYTRFLDLQRAESQTREAHIEMSLEKVRSRTMAMQTSSELPEAANTLFLEVQALGIPAWSAGYCIWQDDKHNANCNMSSEGEIQKGFILPSIGEGYDFYTPQEKGEHFYVKELGGEALVKHYEFMKQLPNMGEILKELIDAGLELPIFQIFHIVYFKFGYVMFITYEEVPKAHDIFKRFGQVFEQTYTRFLDLERAEAQAREAKIEMALEKVRSRTMAMQKSDELQDAAQLLFNEIRGLGIPSWSCGYNILSDDKKSAECWMSSEGQQQKPFTLIYEKEESFIEMYDFFKGDDTFLIQELSATALQSHYDFLKSFPDLVPIFNDLQKAEISLPTYQINHLCKFSQGYLLFITYEPVPEAHELFVRFTKVFEQTYTRFLDLKQAEARARESQIQTALERVRSHSMGMQSTADFANVTTEMFTQLRSFGEDLFATGIVFCDKHEGHVEQWHSIPGAGMLSPMIVPIDLDYIHQYRYDQWKAGTTLFSIEIPSDFIEQHFEAIFKLPSAQVTLKDLESRNAPMPAPPDWEIDYGASFKHGYVLASSLKPIENMDILPRFAQVFEQAYIRFLDLQKAEAQARESQIEAALEKVRSRTLAMQKSDELADTSVVVFKELLELGIEPNRLFIGIIKNNGDAIEAWATNEDGSKIEQHFKLYTSKNKSIKKMVAGWKQQKKSAIIDMQGKELQEYFHYLNKVMQIPFIHGLKQKKRVQSIAYFSGGLIGMAAPEEQPEETINLLERFAAVFNLTYTRFNDLKIAEAQAEQAEQDLINLQKAKKNAEKALAELQNTQKQLIQSEKMASLGELTAGIAHEIQNPLNFVNNFSEVSKELLDEMLEEIENGDMDEVRAIMRDVIQNLEKINHHGQRADGIVKGMLQHSRASGDKKEATDINALADEYLRLAYHGLRAKDKSFNAQLVTDFDDGIVKVSIIPQDIGRVVLNLLTNAFYAVHEKTKENIQDFEPTVSVRTKKTQDSVILEVKDNGNGIPDSVKEKIFQPFFTTKPTGQGTGLGLSMSYDIIAKGHDGELQVESTENEGTTFRIILPLNKNNS